MLVWQDSWQQKKKHVTCHNFINSTYKIQLLLSKAVITKNAPICEAFSRMTVAHSIRRPVDDKAVCEVVTNHSLDATQSPPCQKLHKNTVAWKSTKAGYDRMCIQMAWHDGWLGTNPVSEHHEREVEGVMYPWEWQWKMECHSKVNGKECYRWWIHYDDERFS